MKRRIALVVGLVVSLTTAGCLTSTIGSAWNDDGVGSDVFQILEMGGGCPDAEATDCVTIDTPDDSLPPEQGGCFVTGIGTFGKGNTRDSFGGNGMYMKDGRVRGEWEHVDHFDVTGAQKNGQNLFHGDVEFLRCEKYPALPGPDVPKAEPNFATWGGTGRYNGALGYRFQVWAWDHGEPGNLIDRYAIKVWDAEGVVVLAADGSVTPTSGGDSARDMGCKVPVPVDVGVDFANAMGCISGGNFQIHPANNGHPYGDGALPVWAAPHYAL
jgi:hypothetical protein